MKETLFAIVHEHIWLQDCLNYVYWESFLNLYSYCIRNTKQNYRPFWTPARTGWLCQTAPDSQIKGGFWTLEQGSSLEKSTATSPGYPASSDSRSWESRWTDSRLSSVALEWSPSAKPFFCTCVWSQISYSIRENWWLLGKCQTFSNQTVCTTVWAP